MSPRTKEQNEEIRRQRMNQIISAAAEVYLRKGIMMEIRDVAAEAGLGYGTVYHYYKNKIALLDDVLWQAFEQAELLTVRSLAGAAPTAEKLRAFGIRLLDRCLADRSVFILYKMITENFHPLQKDRFTKIYDNFRDKLYRPVSDAVASCLSDKGATDVQSAADAYTNMLLGSLVGYAGLHIHHGHNGVDAGRLVGLLLREL